MKLKDYVKPRQHIKKQRHYFANKGLSSQNYGFSGSHVWVWENYKESWVSKNWCFWTVVLKKSLESPSDSKEIQPVHPKGNQSWILIGGTDVEAETPVFWPPDPRTDSLEKTLMRWKIEDLKEKGTTEDEMVVWRRRLNGHEFEQAPGGGDREGSLTCCSPWGHKELNPTEWLNWTD